MARPHSGAATLHRCLLRIISQRPWCKAFHEGLGVLGFGNGTPTLGGSSCHKRCPKMLNSNTSWISGHIKTASQTRRSRNVGSHSSFRFKCPEVLPIYHSKHLQSPTIIQSRTIIRIITIISISSHTFGHAITTPHSPHDMTCINMPALHRYLKNWGMWIWCKAMCVFS